MEADLIKSQSNFEFHIDGKNEIDAEILSDIISNMAGLAKSATQEINPEAYLKMNVTAFKNGSFQIDFSAICEGMETLLALSPAAGLAANVVSAVNGFLQIKKHLKGSPPKSITPVANNQSEVENKDGQKFIVHKASTVIINNYRIDNMVGNIARDVKEHNPDGGFTMSTPEGKTKFEAKDVDNISKPLPIENIEEKLCKVMHVEADLPIKKVDLLGRSTWEFKYKDHGIKARVLDDELIEKVHNGASLRAGDYIHAKMEMRCDLDPFGNPIKDTEQYTVIDAGGKILHEDIVPQTTISNV
jgi:uncharacterized protein YxjI